MAEDFDMQIDGEAEGARTPKPRKRTVTRKRVVKRPVAARRRAAETYDLGEDDEPVYTHQRPRISIDAATTAPRKVNLYRRLAMGFLGATVVLIGVIIFFTFQKANITIHQQSLPVAASFSADVVDGASSSTTAFQGLVVTVTTSTQAVYKPTTTVDKPGKSHGIVTVYNNGSTVQSLVATTRFLSEGGVLFRATHAVTIAPHATAEAEIAADKPGSSGDIGPGKFTIPGLNPAQQKLVYGVSTTAMTGGSGKVGVVTQADIDKAQEDARKALLEIGQRELTSVVVPPGDDVLYTTVNIKAESSVKAGDQVSEFIIKTSGTMAYVAYPKTAVYAAADREVQAKAPTSYHKVVFANEAPAVSLQTIDVLKKTATLQIYREGVAVLDARSAALQPTMFMGQTKTQIVDQLKSIKGVTDVDVTFMPPWIDHAPKVSSRIDVTIEQTK